MLFGAAGDLARRKLFPGLFWLYRHGRLPEIRIVGTGRKARGSDAEFRDSVEPEGAGPPLFTSTDEVELLWKLCDPVLADPPPSLPYAQGSWGPQEAIELPGPRGWRVADA